MGSPEPTASVILPVHNQGGHIGAIVEAHLAVLTSLTASCELVLVANACSDDSVEVCSALEERHPAVRLVDLSEGGWGRAVKAGLAAARGDVLCYSNSARTTPEILRITLEYGTTYPAIVVKANRKIRDGWARRTGSLLYNLECRMLFDLPTWDINGTPKVFPRSFSKLLALARDDDLIDAEFNLICRRERYPVIEVPVLETRRHGGKSTTNLRSAARLYLGAYALSRRAPGLGAHAHAR